MSTPDPIDSGLPIGIGADDGLARVLEDSSPLELRRPLATVLIGGTVISGVAVVAMMGWLALYSRTIVATLVAAMVVPSVFLVVRRVVLTAWRFGFSPRPILDDGDEAMRLLRAVGRLDMVPRSAPTPPGDEVDAGERLDR